MAATKSNDLETSEQQVHSSSATTNSNSSTLSEDVSTVKAKEHLGSPDADSSPVPKSLRFKLTIFFLCLVSMVGAMDSVIVAACLPAIAKDLKSTSVETFWVGTSFLLAQTATIPIYGTASEVFGRKPCILSAIALFTFASIICATAENIGWLIGARTVQGVGAGGTIQLVQVITSDITTLRERGLYMAFTSLSWAIGSIGGIPIGGAIGRYTDWSWIFWINLPICAPSFIGLVYCLNLQKDDSPFMTKLARIDWLGLAVFTSASTLFLVGLTTGGVDSPWSSPKTLAPLIVGAVLYATFILVQAKISQHPMMPLRIFKDRTAITGFTTSFFVGMIVWSIAYYMIIFFIGALQHDIFRASVESLSVCAFIAPGAVVASILIKRTLRFKHLVTAGWVMVVVGLGLNTTMKSTSSSALIYGPRFIAGLGLGILFPTPMFAVQVKQQGEDVGIATSVQVFLRCLGMTFGVAIGGVIFTNRWENLVTAEVADGTIPRSMYIAGNQAELAYEFVKAMPENIQLVYRKLYADSMRTVWWAMMAFAIVGLAVSLISKDETLNLGLQGKQNFVEKKRKSTVVEEAT